MHEACNNFNEEVWRDIPGYNGRYQASTFGRIKSVGNPIRINHTFVMKPQKRGEGNYLGIRIYEPGSKKPKSRYIHTLVMLTFVGHKPEGMHINHKDLNKQNNRLNNLEYVTARENACYSLARDIDSRIDRERFLTQDEVREIRAASEAISSRALGRQYDVSHETIRCIRLGKRWQYID